MMNKVRKIGQIGVILGLSCGLLLRATPASAASRIVCESDRDNYNFCRIDTRGGVILRQQLSSSACIQGRNWGYDRDGIWVDDGCRAEFEVQGRGSSSNRDRRHRGRSDRRSNNNDAAAIVGGVIAVAAIAAAIDSGSHHNDKDDRQTITCMSRHDDYTRCSADIRGGRVTLKRQLSSAGCWEGDTWGHDRNAIWVDDGCRGEFQIRR